MANQTLNNLKIIHDMQKEGIINAHIKEVRSSKVLLDSFAQKLQARAKAITLEEENKKKLEQEIATKVVTEKAQEVKPTASEQAFSNSQAGQNRFKRFDNEQKQNKFSSQRPNDQRSRDFKKDGFGKTQNQKPNFNKPGQNKKLGNNFVSTKTNSFRSFASSDAPEIDVKAERNFANKAKFAQKHSNNEERKIQNKKSSSTRKNNVFVEDENGFEEISYGSRKNVAKKKKESAPIQVAVITHAVMTSKEFTVKELSEKIGKPVNEIVKKLMLLGIMATINSNIDFETAELVASDFGITLELKAGKSFEEKLLESAKTEDDESLLIKRPPIVAVMGHVDHGKTSLLDAFRKTNVVGGEAGGITQRIGAYQIEFNGEKITFIDTPGHAAFTQMRARGAQATDIAILVVAADDGIMPQTIEAINHIKAAGVPMIVAINKMDKPEANPDRVKQQLAENNILPEEWGGDAICVPCSAKTGAGLDDLKQTILLVAEMQELKANPNKMAVGVVIEAELDKSRGPVANIIVQNGTLHVGDSVMTGITYGKVRAMFDDKGKSIKSAEPSKPVSILGLNEVPSSGDEIYGVEETLSKAVIQERIDRIKKERATQSSGVTLDTFMNRVQEGSLKNLNIVLKADTMGSVEALKASLLAIRNEEAKVNIVHSGTGAVTESDVSLAQTTGSVIINFNQKTSVKVKNMADSAKIEIKEYNIIYDVVDDITNAINGMLSVKYEEKYIGTAEIRMVFKLSTAGKVAGSYVKDGKVTRNAVAVVKRGDEEIGKTTVDSLKIVKDEKAEVAKGFECGIKLHDNIDFKEGDIIEFYVKEVIKRV